MKQENLDKLTQELNQTMAKMGFFFRSPNMRYWRIKKDSYAFAWTTEKCQKKFWTLKYRILKNGNWKLIKKVSFGKRKVAKARVNKWFEERKRRLSL